MIKKYKLKGTETKKMYFVATLEQEDSVVKYKLTSVKDIPDNIVEALGVSSEFTVNVSGGDSAPTPEPEAPGLKQSKVCLFDGAPGDFQRTVGGQIVYLCEQDYYSKNIGKIYAKLRS